MNALALVSAIIANNNECRKLLSFSIRLSWNCFVVVAAVYYIYFVVFVKQHSNIQRKFFDFLKRKKKRKNGRLEGKSESDQSCVNVNFSRPHRYFFYLVIQLTWQNFFTFIFYALCCHSMNEISFHFYETFPLIRFNGSTWFVKMIGLFNDFITVEFRMLFRRLNVDCVVQHVI